MGRQQERHPDRRSCDSLTPQGATSAARQSRFRDVPGLKTPRFDITTTRRHPMTSTTSRAALALAGLLAAASVQAQSSTADGIAKYREMLQDGNPAELFEMKGEELWKQKRGPKNASLEQCDLGKGPGVIKGAFVELPRYFKDTGR